MPSRSNSRRAEPEAALRALVLCLALLAWGCESEEPAPHEHSSAAHGAGHATGQEPAASPVAAAAEVAPPAAGAARAHGVDGDGASARLDGPWEERWPDGRPKARGRYRSGVRTGVFESWYEDGSVESRGSYLEGAKEGVWIHRRRDGVVDMELTGVYEDGERIRDWWEEGIRIGELRSGVTQKSEYRHGLRNGRALGFHEDGSRASAGRYADGLMTGPWVHWRQDGSVDAELTGYYENHDKVRELEPAELAALLAEVER